MPIWPPPSPELGSTHSAEPVGWGPPTFVPVPELLSQRIPFEFAGPPPPFWPHAGTTTATRSTAARPAHFNFPLALIADSLKRVSVSLIYPNRKFQFYCRNTSANSA